MEAPAGYRQAHRPGNRRCDRVHPLCGYRDEEGSDGRRGEVVTRAAGPCEARILACAGCYRNRPISYTKMVWSMPPALTWATSTGFHPRTGNSFETTRDPGFKCFSRLGFSRSLESVVKNMVTTSAGLKSTRNALPSTMRTRSARPSDAMRC